MFRSSFPIGRLLGVELRLHLSVPALFALALIYSETVTGTVLRGFGLCLALLLGIAIRELARALTAAYNELSLRGLLVFPVGSIMAFASAGTDLEASTRMVTIVAPFANLLAGLIFLGISYGIDRNVHLLTQPWISPTHVLRSLVWTQFALAAVSFAPVAALTSRQIQLPEAGPYRPLRAALPFLNIGALIGVALLTAGGVLRNAWLFLFGGFVLLATRPRRGSSVDSSLSGSMLVRNAMQTDFTFLSSSDTLRSALERTISSPQEAFPVVRGDQLVGSVARSTLLRQLGSEGDGYLQGVMTRTMPLAFPDEALTAALSRSAAAGQGEVTAVVQDGVLLGVLTPAGMRGALQRTAALHLLRREDTEG